MLHSSEIYRNKILIILFMIDILRALDVDSMEDVMKIIRQLETEPFDDGEKNNEDIQSLLEVVGFEEGMDCEVETPIQGRDVPMEVCDFLNIDHQQQQPILQPFTSNEVKVPQSSSNESFVPQVKERNL